MMSTIHYISRHIHLVTQLPYSFGHTPKMFIWSHDYHIHLVTRLPYSFGHTPQIFIWSHNHHIYLVTWTPCSFGPIWPTIFIYSKIEYIHLVNWPNVYVVTRPSYCHAYPTTIFRHYLNMLYISLHSDSK